MAEFTVRHIEGLALHSLTGGSSAADNPPLLFVHGAWHGAWCWQKHFMPFFAAMGYDTHAIDLRGHGQSDKSKSMRWHCIADYVDDVEAAITSLNRKPVVIGHSMGGFVSQHLLARQPEIAGMCLLATVPSFGAWRITRDIALQHPLTFAKLNLMMSLYPVVADPQRAREMFLDTDTSQEDLAAFHATLSDESYRAFLDMVALALPKRAKSPPPLLVVGGGEDKLFPPESQRHTAHVLGCECSIIEGAPHDLMLSARWQQSAEIIEQWLSSPGVS